MGLESSPQKAKVTIECSHDDRAYIKMLAAREHVTISEYMMAKVRPDFPKERKANTDTLKAIKDSREGKGIKCDSLEDFWEKMGMDPNA